MGLDMYLEAHHFVGRYDWNKPTDLWYTSREDFASFEALSGIPDLCKYADFAGIAVHYPVGYWRKANAIHGWFVKEVGGGVDDCSPMHVERQQLLELRDLCHSVINASSQVRMKELAESVLPPTQGFFFGSDAIDEDYLEDLRRTVTIIDHALSVIPEDDWTWSFAYQASW